MQVTRLYVFAFRKFVSNKSFVSNKLFGWQFVWNELFVRADRLRTVCSAVGWALSGAMYLYQIVSNIDNIPSKSAHPPTQKAPAKPCSQWPNGKAKRPQTSRGKLVWNLVCWHRVAHELPAGSACKPHAHKFAHITHMVLCAAMWLHKVAC